MSSYAGVALSWGVVVGDVEFADAVRMTGLLCRSDVCVRVKLG